MEHCWGSAALLARTGSGTGRRPPLVCSNFGANRLTGSIPPQMSSLTNLVNVCVRLRLACLCGLSCVLHSAT
jgi:hypothetical protein